MNAWLRNIIALAGSAMPLSMLRNGKNYPPFMPFYHVVSDQQLDYINSYVVRSQNRFEKELDYLLGFYQPVSLEDMIQSPDKRKMHLSFDDGLKECSSIIAPILIRKGIPASFFVNPDFVDNQQIFHRFKRAILESKHVIAKGGKQYFINDDEELNRMAKEHSVQFSDYAPYMSLTDIKTLQKQGFSIGAHSLNHPEMWLLSYNEQYRQIKESMDWLNLNVKPSIKAFSFPFTDDGIPLELFKQIHQEQLVDVTFGTAGLKYDVAMNHYQRIPVELKTNWSIKKVVHYEYFYFFVRSLFNKNKVIR